MTLVSSIITKAMRETNLIVVGTSPTTAEMAEGVDLMNNIILSTVGNEAGDPLDDVNVGGTYDQSSLYNTTVPKNARLVVTNTAARTLYLDRYPYEGQRVSVVDVGGNLATYPLTLNASGRLIEGAASLALSTNSLTRQWMYRSDTGSWARVSDLTSTDELPFPQEFDDYFITVLAMRINPRHSVEVSPQTLEALKRSRRQLRARYNHAVYMRPDLDTRRFSAEDQESSFSNYDFNIGRLWPYL